VFQEVIRDDEVEAGIGNRREPLAVVEDVDVNQRFLLELRPRSSKTGRRST
jgi:hypothetical protein